MKKIVLLAAAIVSFAACTSDSYTGDQDPSVVAGEKPISFGSGLNAVTRADKTGAEAATDLNGQFFVYGIKKESADGAGNVQAGNLVYNNYVVKWGDNSAFTTTSNTAGWEYVGYTLTAKEQANVTANSADAVQTIKYWDFGAADYTFYAVSALPEDIENDRVTIVKNQTATTAVYDNGYTVTVTADADLDKLYFAERVNILSSNNAIRTQDNTYGGNVTFRFHNTATKVRVAMYETVPGYSVKINNFSVVDAANPAFTAMTTSVTDKFAANLQYSAKGTAGSMTVTYDATETATKNYPIVAFTPTGGKTNILALGTNLKATTVLGENVTNATYDQSTKAYTSVFPNEANTQNLKLKLSYTLTAPVTGETITVTDATAEIPAKYLQWKPGFAYTYIFKISDNTNGYTGDNTKPSGLYPITFDAVEVLAEDGQAEYITTVSEPSITTFAYDTTNKVYLHDGSEYAAGYDIYATVVVGSTVINPSTTGSYKVYTVATSDATNFPITEASVAESIAETSTGTKKITCTEYTTNVSVVTTVPGEDGNNVTVTGAIKMGSAAANTYAVEYTPTSGNKVYKVIVVH